MNRADNQRISILSIDGDLDHSINVNALIMKGFPEVTIHTACTEQKGLYLATEFKPDVILIDIGLPLLNGFEVCRKLKADKELRDIPVVFIIASKEARRNRALAQACGADAFLSKPIDYSELIVHINAMIKIRRASILMRYDSIHLAALAEDQNRALKAENEARIKSEQSLLEAQKLAHIGSYEHDIAKNEITWTEEGLQIYGVQNRHLLETPDMIYKLIHPDDRAAVIQCINQSILEKHETDCCYRIIRPDGEECLIELHFTPFFNDAGVLTRTMGTIQDITIRKQMEEALKTSEDKFRYVFDNSAVGKSLTLPSGEMQVNAAMCEMLGYSAEELQGKKWEEISHPDDIDFTQQEIGTLLSGRKQRVRLNKRYIKKNGDVLWADVLSSICRDVSGKPPFLYNCDRRYYRL